MISRKWTLSIGVVAAALCYGLGTVAGGSPSVGVASSAAQEPSRSVPGGVLPRQPTAHGDGVKSDVWIQSTGPLLDPAADATVQVVAYSVIWRSDQNRHLSDLNAQRTLPAASNQEIREDIYGIHPNLGQPVSPSDPMPHAYRISIRPLPGLTWGQASDSSLILFDVIRVE